ncbi:class I SAM-dependent methyltransferase [Alkalibacillus almallahensis]|uniref:class I SAM-dependent methyltransferase n=1 Tax=Alkalibacillus almallahensis TaxID=1379154 RepID=UPI0014222F50|nr:class I SAM-dependent methyltransferase [Alkalibacillus almallahensis]NIK12127.1 tRNA G37 N-methylase Trm5 [Alkalibacillus almallahensis]
MKQIIPFAHQWISETLNSGDIVVDATLGNGHDSVALSQEVGPNGHVYSFDIQQSAIDQAQSLFNQNDINNITSVKLGHEQAKGYLNKQGISSIGGVIFNLGFLPGGDESITTQADSTIQAIDSLFELLMRHRMIVIVIYPGHDSGQIEKDLLIQHLQKQPAAKMDVAMYHMVNRSNNAPFVVGIYKK